MSLPVSLRLTNRLAAIVGGGSVALRKAQAMLDAGARLRIIAPRIDPHLREIVEQSSGELFERPFESGDIDGCSFVVVATNDDATNAAVITLANLNGILTCDAVRPERGDVTMLATVRVGELTFTADSGGGTPAFSKRLADEITSHFGPEYAAAGRALAKMRELAKITVPDAQRAQVMRDLAQRDIATLADMSLHEIENALEDAHNALATSVSRVQSSAICATRASALALTQTKMVAAQLALRGIATTLLQITTRGDTTVDRPIAAVGENVFVKELEHALAEHRADYAVHSAKDLPSTLAPEFVLAAFSKREDPRDAFCSERYSRFEDLPIGARVGTSSPRRVAQLAHRRPDLAFEAIRGNIDTRLRKLREGNFDAIILAMAGLSRLHIRATHTHAFAIDELIPAVGQGALAIETRADATNLMHELYAALNDEATERAVRCERAALAALHAGCNAPIGIHAVVHTSSLRVYAAFLDTNGNLQKREYDAVAASIDEAEAHGRFFAQRIAEAVG